MAESAGASLRKLLVSSYEGLKQRLAARFGSVDVATEVLHETWLRLDKMADTGAVREPHSYLYRMAVNVAIDRHRADARWINKAQIEALLRFDDEQPDPERIVAARSQIAELERALRQLPARRRAIFMAALVEELPYRDIAKRFGISLRSVEREMSRAFDYCSEKFEKDGSGLRNPGPGGVLDTEAARAETADNDHED